MPLSKLVSRHDLDAEPGTNLQHSSRDTLQLDRRGNLHRLPLSVRVAACTQVSLTNHAIRDLRTRRRSVGEAGADNPDLRTGADRSPDTTGGAVGDSNPPEEGALATR